MEKLPTIFLEQKVHKKEEQLLLRFSFNQKLITLVKSTDGTYWSKTLNVWYLKNTPKNLNTIITLFKGITNVDVSKIKKQAKFERNLTTKQKTLLNNFYLFLRGKRYSKSTIETYTFFIADFISFHTSKKITELTNRDVELFIETVFIERNYAISTQRQFISAVKVFITFCPNCKINSIELIRPKKSKKLPNVLSQEEVLTIIRVTQNLKHRAIIALIYSCGLRISELINLELSDFQTDRKQLFIRDSKGRKDRYVSLADNFMPLLSNYYNSYLPKKYFVEGKESKKYSAESVRQFLKKSARKAQIKKVVTPHTLRHSYATHLLENGVDIRYIQSLLGHSRPETTMIYTHVKRKDLMEIQNPLDTAIIKAKKTDKESKNVFLSRYNI